MHAFDHLSGYHFEPAIHTKIQLKLVLLLLRQLIDDGLAGFELLVEQDVFLVDLAHLVPALNEKSVVVAKELFNLFVKNLIGLRLLLVTHLYLLLQLYLSANYVLLVLAVIVLSQFQLVRSAPHLNELLVYRVHVLQKVSLQALHYLNHILQVYEFGLRVILENILHLLCFRYQRNAVLYSFVRFIQPRQALSH